MGLRCHDRSQPLSILGQLPFWWKVERFSLESGQTDWARILVCLTRIEGAYTKCPELSKTVSDLCYGKDSLKIGRGPRTLHRKWGELHGNLSRQGLALALGVFFYQSFANWFGVGRFLSKDESMTPG